MVGQLPGFDDLDQPPHSYFQRTPTDRFTRIKAALEAGRISLDRSGEKAFLQSLLRELEIPASSQMLVFSTTSLQLSLINPANPRALFFNEDTYLGFIPGGRIEVLALDPELGSIFYIFDVPRSATSPVVAERATRCMNCHAGSDTGHVPGLVIKSVAPGPTGGSLDSFRRGQSGHGIPLDQRFGGWYVTGMGGLTNHWGNLIGELSDGVLSRIPNPPGTRFSFDRYPVATSDILPQLLHEHQAGFVNRVVEATYRTRTHLYNDHGELTPEHQAEVEEQARRITRYLLFTDEVPLPEGGIEGDAKFKADFLRNRRPVDGAALKDLDLKTRLFRYRCSYMVYSPVFSGLPPPLKERVYRQLGDALDTTRTEETADHPLPVAEKRVVRRILRETLSDLPDGW